MTEFNQEIAAKYALKKDEDFWFHDQSRSWIVKHDAIVRIADIEDITLTIVQTIESTPQHKALMVRAHKPMGEAEPKIVYMLGECAVGSTPISKTYPWAMAQKRAEDRAVLRIIAPGGGLYSDVEADDFRKAGTSAAEPGFKRETAPATFEDMSEAGEVLRKVIPHQRNSDKLVNSDINFGKHKGRKFQDLAADEEGVGYLEWLAMSAYKEDPNPKNWKFGSSAALCTLHRFVYGDETPQEEQMPEDVPF